MPAPADASVRRPEPTLTPGLRGSLESLPAIPAAVFGAGWDRAILVSLIVVTACILTWLAGGAPIFGAPGAHASLLARHSVAGIVTALAACIALRAGFDSALDHRTRRFWRITASAMTLGTVFSLIALGAGQGSDPASLISDTAGLFASLLSGVVLLLALLQLPNAPMNAVDQSKLWLDIATVAVGGMLVGWYDYTTVQAPPVASWTMTFVLLHLLTTVELILILVVAVLWRRTVLHHRANVLLVVAVALTIAFVAHGAAVVEMAWSGALPGWLHLTIPLSHAVIAAAGWVSCVTVMQRAVRTQTRHDHSPSHLIPYVAVLPGFVLLLRLAHAQGTQPLLGLVFGVVVLTVLAFARQLASTREVVRALTEAAAKQNEARFQALVQHSSDVITILDTDGTIRYVSPSMLAVLGHDPITLVNTNIGALLHPEDVEAAGQFLEELARTRDVVSGAKVAPGSRKQEWRIAHAKGGWMTVDNVGTNLLQESVIRGLVLNTRDVTEQSVIKQQYMHQAFHDALTDLANRSLFLYQVGNALARAKRQQSPVTILFLDLDNFKNVNDSLGHAAGDRLLVEAARRLASSVRDSDLLARLSGDEFAVLVENSHDQAESLEIAERIRVSLARPFLLSGKEVFVTASVGIAQTAHGETADDLVRNADVAMYVAKTRGKGQAVVFEPAMHTAALERLVVEADLRRAVEREEFFLQYQPIVELSTGDIVGAEALVRWMCRDRGAVPPAVFIPIAEETGLIVTLGRYVLRRACRQAKQWTDERGVPLRITVNLSGRQLQEPGIVDDVRDALHDSGLDPSQLVLELTESMLMQNTELSLVRLTALKTLGISVAIDDFGTGYSSLSYLQRYPVDMLKIDKTFVDDIDNGGEGPVLARAIVALGETLQMSTVAEGIETAAQRGHLLQLGCELGQGFLFAPPLDVEEFWQLLLARGSTSPMTVRRRRDMSVQAA